MSHTLHYKVSIVGALISSIAFTALAVFAIAPGETLDPVNTHNNVCSGPTDFGCTINPYENLNSNSVLYLDGNGDITTDTNFVRNGAEFFVGGEFSVYDSNLDVYTDLRTSFSMGDDLGTILGNLPGVGMAYTQDDYVSFMGIVDSTGGPPGIQTKGLISLSSVNNDYVSAFLLAPDGTIAISTEANSIDNGSRLQIMSDELILDHSFDDGNDSIKISLNPDGVKFSFLNDSESYLFPITDGTNGQVLQTNGSGQILWATVSGGSSSISLNNANTLYSDSIGAGQGHSTLGNNIILGKDAGVGTSSLYSTNILGKDAGSNSIAGYESNFFGIEAGGFSQNAYKSNFIGIGAGYNSQNTRYSNFLGSRAGNAAIGAANSIFIGRDSGANNNVNNFNNPSPGDGTSCVSFDCYSILLGNYTSTGGFSNSIAIGAYATNTASNQFMIGSTERPINEIVVVQTGGTECIIDTNGLGCTSDENLKTNITSLASTLEILLNIDAVTYNWNHDPNGSKQIGFIAQNLETYFPELVSTNSRGQKSVYYAQMTPILTKAIQELDLKVSLLESQTIASGGFSLTSLTTLAKDFLADVGNGIQNIFAKKITTEELCVGNTCISESELIELLESRETPLEEQDYIIIPELNQPEDQEILPIEDNEDEQEIVLESEENFTSEIPQEIVVE